MGNDPQEGEGMSDKRSKDEILKAMDEAAGQAKQDFMLDYTFATLHEIHRKAAAMVKADWRPAFLAGSVGAFATPAEIRAFRAELDALAERFQQEHSDPARPGTGPVAVTFAVLPATKDDAQALGSGCVFDWDGST